MKYIININQKAIMSLGLDLDIIDMAIFDEVYCYMQSSRRQKLSTPEGEFFLILPRYIIDDMPLLGVKSEAVIRRHLAKLADAGLLVRYSQNQQIGRSYYRLGEIVDRLVYEGDEPARKEDNEGLIFN